MTLLGSLRNRLLLGLSLLFGLFLALALLGSLSMRNLGRAVDRELDVLTRSSALATDLVSGVAEQIRVGEAYLLEPVPGLRAEFLQVGDSNYARQRRYRQLPGLSPRDQAILNRIEQDQSRLEVAYATAHALRDQDRLAEAREAASAARGPGDTLIANVRELGRSQQARVQGRAAALRRLARERQALVLVLVGLAVTLGAGTAYLTVRSIDAPLQDLIEAARRFGEGDLRPTQLGAMPRELATLALAMGTMGGRLRAVIEHTIREARGISLSAADLSAMSEELSASSHEITKAISGVTVGAEQQAHQVRNADTMLARLRQASAQDLTATERVVALSESTRTLARQHSADLAAAAEALQALREEVRRAATETRGLARLVDQSGEVGELARQLASETDVLALNTAMEASRASGSGTGFTAVGDEMRRLAETSRASAERVTTVTESMRARADEVLAALRDGAVKAAESEATARRSAVALQEIGRLADAMRDIAARVARSTEESKEVGSRFADLRAHLEQIAQENVVASEAVTAAAAQQSEATDDIATSAASLLEASERLAALVAGFKI